MRRRQLLEEEKDCNFEVHCGFVGASITKTLMCQKHENRF